MILALPRGGVPVGYEIALALKAPLEVLISRKLGAPEHPELGIGAVAPGVRVIDENLVQRLGISEAYIEGTTQQEQAEIQRREQSFRGSLPAPEIEGRTVILVDDGLATGVTARAAIQAIRSQAPGVVVLAVPVCATQTAYALSKEVDELVVLEMPDDFRAVGYWYDDFTQTTDDEVLALLEDARRRASSEP